jgi:predicted small metal-binding protein
MKTMTCKQMGGGCDEQIQGSTAQEMVTNGSKHLMESAVEEDKQARQMMEDMQNDPVAQKKWMDDFEQKFAQLPED